MLRPVGEVGADGNEMLGEPSITIAPGTGVVSDGIGLGAGGGTVTLNVPAGGVVKQVLAYWECLSDDVTHQIDDDDFSDGEGADNTLTIEGIEVTGEKIGSRYFGSSIFSASFRADITGLDLVGDGTTTVLDIEKTTCLFNDGASIVVIYDDGGPKIDIQVRDGNDTAYLPYSSPNDTTTPVNFQVAAAPFNRHVDLTLIVGGVDLNRPNAVLITVGGVQDLRTDVLNSNSGGEWDDVTVDVLVPAGQTSVTAQLLSYDDPTERQPASLQWVGAILTSSGAPDVCPPNSGHAQSTKGRAFGVDASALSLKLVDHLGAVSSAAPGPPKSDDAKLLLKTPPQIADLVTAKVNSTQSNSSLNPPQTTSSATLADVSLLRGLVKAVTVKGVSQSVASPHSASYNSAGSVIQGLVVNNTAVAVKPNLKVAVTSLGIPVAELVVYGETGSSTFRDDGPKSDDDGSKASHKVTMLGLTLLKPLFGFPAGTKVTLGHAESAAEGPTSGCPTAKSVSGEAYTVLANGHLAGKTFVNAKEGSAVLPPTGGADSDGLAANIPGVATSLTAANTTSGSLSPHPHATSQSRVEKAALLGGRITADLLDVRSTSSATGAAASTTFTSTFTNLKIGDTFFAGNVSFAPNTVLWVDLGAVGFVKVTLNEQIVGGNGTTDTQGDIRAIHARVYAVGGLFMGDVIVSSAHSDAHA